MLAVGYSISLLRTVRIMYDNVGIHNLHFPAPESKDDISGYFASAKISFVLTHSVKFDASGMSSGVYIYRLSTGGQSLTGRMLLMK